MLPCVARNPHESRPPPPTARGRPPRPPRPAPRPLRDTVPAHLVLPTTTNVWPHEIWAKFMPREHKKTATSHIILLIRTILFYSSEPRAHAKTSRRFLLRRTYSNPIASNLATHPAMILGLGWPASSIFSPRASCPALGRPRASQASVQQCSCSALKAASLAHIASSPPHLCPTIHDQSTPTYSVGLTQCASSAGGSPPPPWGFRFVLRS